MPVSGGLNATVAWEVHPEGRTHRQRVILGFRAGTAAPDARMVLSGSAVTLEYRTMGPTADPRQRYRMHRRMNQHRSGLLIGGMTLLLALCGWVGGGEPGAWRAVLGGSNGYRHPTPEPSLRRFGAIPLQPQDGPALFSALNRLCRRAGLSRQPDLYVLPDNRSMNAYAFGGPGGSAIIVTAGLLRGMTMDEITGILAHEVGHICNNDGWVLRLATSLHQAVALTAWSGQWRQPMLAALFSYAPAIGHMLHMALSRIREFDADALALELVDDPTALIVALHKLERHHTGGIPTRPPADNDPGRLLRSHPHTWERVGTLLHLGAPG